MAYQVSHNVDARYNTNNNVDRDLININNYFTVPHHQPSLSPSFNDAPIDRLSTHFIGREKELEHLANVFDTIQGDAPTRCALHGIAGIGKSQLALQYAKQMYDRRRYALVFWISATTIEKLNHGFAKVLDLVEHRDRDHPEQSTRLTSARRWLEEDESVKWLLIFDNVDKGTVDFLWEHLPRKNPRGNILFTTWTKVTADAVVCTAGQQHQTFELRAPGLQDAAKLLLIEAGFDTSNITPSSTSRAEDLVKCVGCLPLAISHAASFVKQSHKSLDDLLDIYRSEHKYQVRQLFFNNLSHNIDGHYLQTRIDNQLGKQSI
jgi:hypothetical protein